jgi:1-acyl-sn-glycerol-3-phosphate acyltransferase
MAGLRVDLFREGAQSGLHTIMVGALLGIWTWCAFGLISAIGYVVCLLVLAVTYPFDKERRYTGRGIRIVGKLMCAAVPMWKFSYQRPVPKEIPARCVCVSNHCSNIDPFLIAHLPWEMKYLAKSVLFRIPFVGWGIKIAGDIPLVRGSAVSVKRAMRRAAWYIDHSMPVFIFPEGTRSTTGELLPFKDGAFRLAIESQAFILPMAVGGTVGALRKGDWKPGFSRGTTLVGTPISTESLTLKDVASLKEQTRQAIVELREQLRSRGFD